MSTATSSVTVNNYEASVYQDGEVAIQTTQRGLEATGGIVYLTILELESLLALARSSDSEVDYGQFSLDEALGDGSAVLFA